MRTDFTKLFGPIPVSRIYSMCLMAPVLYFLGPWVSNLQSDQDVCSLNSCAGFNITFCTVVQWTKLCSLQLSTVLQCTQLKNYSLTGLCKVYTVIYACTMYKHTQGTVVYSFTVYSAQCTIPSNCTLNQSVRFTVEYRDSMTWVRSSLVIYSYCTFSKLNYFIIRE